MIRKSGMTDMRLSRADKLTYALPALPLAVIGIPVYVFLPKFYTDTMGLDISIIGFLLMAVRVFDAVTDPLIGYLSDNTPGRFGRRKPYMAIGSMGLALSILFLFRPLDLSGQTLSFYFGFWLFTLFFFWTLITIPYESLGPELTENYHERTALFAFRDGFLILGTLLAAALPILIDWTMTALGKIPSDSVRFSIMAFLFSPMILVCSFYCIYGIKETFSGNAKEKTNKDAVTIFKNQPFVILITAFTISAFGSNLPATLILYYVEYVLKAPKAEGFLLLYFLTGIVFLPLWMMVSKKIGKKKAWIISMVINTGAFCSVFFLGPGDIFEYGVLVFVSGIGFGAGLVLPSSIQADVIDYDQLLTGQRREGRYIGLWSIAKKLSAALGIGIGLLVLGNTGYTPNMAQGEDTVFMLRVLYALVPCLCNILAIIIICFYPITEQRHAQIQTAKKQQQPVQNTKAEPKPCLD